jgi:hypothetical protein
LQRLTLARGKLSLKLREVGDAGRLDVMICSVRT